MIPADGFFEWLKLGRSKQPHYLQLKDEAPFAFAGIWDQWKNGGLLIRSCAIITTTANELVKPLHNRMPAILHPESYEIWLDQNADLKTLEKLLVPFPASEMKSHPVSSAVNKVQNDNSDLTQRVDAEVGTNLSLF